MTWKRDVPKGEGMVDRIAKFRAVFFAGAGIIDGVHCSCSLAAERLEFCSHRPLSDFGVPMPETTDGLT